MNAPLRKRARLRQLFRRGKAVVGLRKSVQEAADELIDENCDIDEPEVPRRRVLMEAPGTERRVLGLLYFVTWEFFV